MGWTDGLFGNDNWGGRQMGRMGYHQAPNSPYSDQQSSDRYDQQVAGYGGIANLIQLLQAYGAKAAMAMVGMPGLDAGAIGGASGGAGMGMGAMAPHPMAAGPMGMGAGAMQNLMPFLHSQPQQMQPQMQHHEFAAIPGHYQQLQQRGAFRPGATFMLGGARFNPKQPTFDTPVDYQPYGGGYRY